jgi:hypothetical protein
MRAALLMPNPSRAPRRARCARNSAPSVQKRKSWSFLSFFALSATPFAASGARARCVDAPRRRRLRFAAQPRRRRRRARGC